MSNAKAQRVFNTDYLVLSQTRDTLWGKVVYEQHPFGNSVEWSLVMASAFRVQPLTFGPNQVAGFSSDGKHFITATTFMLSEPSSVSSTSGSLRISRPLFLQVLVKGKTLSLYRYQDSEREQFFIRGSDGPVILLEDRPYVESLLDMYFRQYKYQLKQYCTHEQQQTYGDLIRLLRYRTVPLVELVQRINGDFSEPPDTASRLHAVPLLRAGPSHIEQRYTAGGPFPARLGYEWIDALTVAAGVELWHPRLPPFKLQLQVSYRCYDNPSEGYIDEAETAKAAVLLREYVISPAAFLLYNHYDPEVGWFAGAGVGYGYIKHTRRSLSASTNHYARWSVFLPDEWISMPTFHLVLGGLFFQRFDMQVEYVLRKIQVSQPYNETAVHTFTFSLARRFGKIKGNFKRW